VPLPFEKNVQTNFEYASARARTVLNSTSTNSETEVKFVSDRPAVDGPVRSSYTISTAKSSHSKRVSGERSRVAFLAIQHTLVSDVLPMTCGASLVLPCRLKILVTRQPSPQSKRLDPRSCKHAWWTAQRGAPLGVGMIRTLVLGGSGPVQPSAHPFCPGATNDLPCHRKITWRKHRH
jgi:hypothetical protein